MAHTKFDSKVEKRKVEALDPDSRLFIVSEADSDAFIQAVRKQRYEVAKECQRRYGIAAG